MVNPIEWENSLTARNGGCTWPEDCSLSPFVQRREKLMAHPVLTEGFLQLSPEAAMLLGAPTHLPLSHPLKQNLSPKDMTGSDIMKLEVWHGMFWPRTASSPAILLCLVAIHHRLNRKWQSRSPPPSICSSYLCKAGRLSIVQQR